MMKRIKIQLCVVVVLLSVAGLSMSSKPKAKKQVEQIELKKCYFYYGSEDITLSPCNEKKGGLDQA